MAMRKDTPAARAALARRRQRAAQTLQPASGNASIPRSSTSAADRVPKPPTTIRSNRPPMSASQATRQRPQQQQRPKQSLQIPTNDSSDYEQFTTKSKLSPMSKRAAASVSSQAGNMTMDGTLTTAALTSTNSTAQYSTDPESTREVLNHSRKVEEQAKSLLANARSSSQKRHVSSIPSKTSKGTTPATGSPSNSSYRPVHRSLAAPPASKPAPKGRQVQASKSNDEGGPLDARRQKLRSSVPQQQHSTSPQKTPPPTSSNNEQGFDDLLTASRQRRANLETKFKFSGTNQGMPQKALFHEEQGIAASASKPKIGIDSRQRNPSSPSKQNINLPSLSANKTKNDESMSATRRRMEESRDENSELMAIRRKMKSPVAEQHLKIQSTQKASPPSSTTSVPSTSGSSPDRVIPKRRPSPLRGSASPRRPNLPPPSPTRQGMHHKKHVSSPRQSSPLSRIAASRSREEIKQSASMEDSSNRATSSPVARRINSEGTNTRRRSSSPFRNVKGTQPRQQLRQSPTKARVAQREEANNTMDEQGRAGRTQNKQGATVRRSSSPYQIVKGTQVQQQQRPPPIEINHNIMPAEEEETNNVSDQMMRMAMSGLPNTVRTTTPPRTFQQEQTRINSGRISPGVERLSNYLMDTSSVNEVSLVDMTMHQIEPSPGYERNQRYGSSPQKPRPSPQRPSPQQQHNNISSPLRGISPRQPSFTPPTNAANHDTCDDVDDQGTVDDGKLLTMDSACLKTYQTIMLRAYFNNSTVIGIDNHDKENTNNANVCLAEPSGVCLGREEELMEIRKVMSNPNDPEDLRYGDTVVFYSVTVDGCSLGVRSNNDGINGYTSRLSLGFFPSESTVSDTWMILSARSDREVLIGRAAVAAKAPPTPRKGDGAPAPVRSGDHVLIRNCYNGGILSVDGMGNLVLFTDSYESQIHDDPTLIGRLQNHDRLYPSPRETFQLLLSSSPPCPQWVTGRSKDERVYLTGSYILQPRRNQRNAEFESNLFSDRDQSSSILSTVASNAKLSPEMKEKILVDEVIGSFLGLEGRHIRLKGAKGHTSKLDNYEFQLFRADGVSFDSSLAHLVEQILPLSTSYVRVRNFVSSRDPGYEYGRVMHAMCEGLDSLLEEYVTFVAQLERQYRKYSKSDQVTMKSIYYQITPSLHSMSILEHATREVCEKKGGDLINSLWSLDKRSYMGDLVAKKVLGILLDKASGPYMEMMSSWLQTGLLKDPYEEFMIRQTSDSNSEKQPIDLDGDAWMALFEIDATNVLKDIISNDWTKKKILTTGKYWNAVNACSNYQNSYEEKSQIKYTIPKLEFNSDSSAISAYIDNMYQNASRVLMRLMMHNFRLMESLRTVRRYFLLDQGDFLMHFLDASEKELIKQAEDVSIGRVQHFLNTAVQLTEGYRDDFDSLAGTNDSQVMIDPRRLRCRLTSESLVSHLDSLHGGIADGIPGTPSRQVYGMSNKGNTGIEVFQIELPRIPFPLSLALSRHAMETYTLLFRHLFFTKHVERRLISVWRDHQMLKKLDSLRGLLGPTFLLRQRMLHFVQNLLYYMTFEVIESNWMEMVSSIDHSSDPMAAPQSQRHHTVDDILNTHDEFLTKTLEACLLSNKFLIKSLVKLLNTCLLFTEQMRRFMDATKIVSTIDNLWRPTPIHFVFLSLTESPLFHSIR